MMHLTATQIAQWTAGERSSETEAHLAGCAGCRAQVTGFEHVLAQFRGSAHSLPVPAMELRSSRSMLWPRLIAVAAAVLLLAIPVIRQSAAQRRAELEQQDTLLLQQVDAGVSRPVPDAMDPLVKLVTWNSNEAQRQ